MLRLLTLISLLMLAGAAHASQLFVNAPRDGYLNLRSGPSTSYDVQYQMPHGTVVDVLRKDGDWSRIRHESGRTGWAASRYLTTWAEEQPRRPGRVPEEADAQLPVLYVDAPAHGGLNLRKGPGTDKTVLTVMAQGDRVEELGRTGDWRLLRHADGLVGWAHGGYLSDEKPRARQPARTAGGFTPAPRHGQPQGGFRPAPGHGDGWRPGRDSDWRNGQGHAWRDDRPDSRRADRENLDLPDLLLRCVGREGNALANCIARSLIQTR